MYERYRNRIQSSNNDGVYLNKGPQKRLRIVSKIKYENKRSANSVHSSRELSVGLSHAKHGFKILKALAQNSRAAY